MNVLAVLKRAAADGVKVNVSPGGSLEVEGTQAAVNRLRPTLRQHKAEIVRLLKLTGPEPLTKSHVEEATRPLPRWCRADCEDLESITLANEGEVSGCVQPCYDFEQWRRLDWMQRCPKGGKMNKQWR